MGSESKNGLADFGPAARMNGSEGVGDCEFLDAL